MVHLKHVAQGQAKAGLETITKRRSTAAFTNISKLHLAVDFLDLETKQVSIASTVCRSYTMVFFPDTDSSLGMYGFLICARAYGSLVRKRQRAKRLNDI